MITILAFMRNGIESSQTPKRGSQEGPKHLGDPIEGGRRLEPEKKSLSRGRPSKSDTAIVR